jgi:hypothetical protein
VAFLHPFTFGKTELKAGGSELMEQIPDDPIVHQIEESGWPWWMQ